MQASRDDVESVETWPGRMVGNLSTGKVMVLARIRGAIGCLRPAPPPTVAVQGAGVPCGWSVRARSWSGSGGSI